jgi:hypothetical protein
MATFNTGTCAGNQVQWLKFGQTSSFNDALVRKCDSQFDLHLNLKPPLRRHFLKLFLAMNIARNIPRRIESQKAQVLQAK